jgi:hypothetical protein
MSAVRGVMSKTEKINQDGTKGMWLWGGQFFCDTHKPVQCMPFFFAPIDAECAECTDDSDKKLPCEEEMSTQVLSPKPPVDKLRELRDYFLQRSKENSRRTERCTPSSESWNWHKAKADTYQRCADKVQEIINAN